MAAERFVLAGSERAPAAGARDIGTPSPTDIIQVTLVLRRPRPLPPPGQGAAISRGEFAREYGADPADIARVEDFARQFDLTVAGVYPARRSVVLTGSVAAMNNAFGTEMRLYQDQ